MQGSAKRKQNSVITIDSWSPVNTVIVFHCQLELSIMTHCLLLSSHSWTGPRYKAVALPLGLTPDEVSAGGGAGLPPAPRGSPPWRGEVPLPPPVRGDPGGLSRPSPGDGQGPGAA